MNASYRIGLALAAICSLGLILPNPASAQNYTFTNFDGPGDHAGGTVVNGINNNNTEVGLSVNNGGATFTNYLRNPDGSFAVQNTTGDGAQLNGVNKNNIAVGFSGNNAITFTGGVQANLPNFNTNTAAEIAFGINDTGTIVGQYVDNLTDTTPGFVLSGGVFTSLIPTVGATVVNAQGINNNGLVVGFYSQDGVHQHGFTYNTQTNGYTLLADPSTARITADGLVLTQFLGVNDSNQAVGYYQTNNGSQFGFRYNLNTNAYSFLDDPQAAPIDGVQVTQITGISNNGTLSGFFSDANSGTTRGFIAAAAPEPGSLALVLGAIPLLGLSAIVRRRTRR